MQIAEQLVLLAELQNVEQKLRDANRRVEELPVRSREAQAVAEDAAKKAYALETQQREQETERRKLESDLAAEKDKMRKWQNRADQIRGEREHAALTSEIGAQKRTIGRIEENILERMQTLEDLGTLLEAAQSLAATTSKLAEEEWEKVRADVDAAKAEAEKIGIGRDAMLQKLPVPLVKRYERIANARQGLGVAMIRGETCLSCRRTLPPQLCLQVYRGEILETCPSCQRILVHEASTRSAGADAAAEAADDEAAAATGA